MDAEYQDPGLDPDVLKAANDRHDAEMRRMGMDITSRVRPAWNESKLIVRGKLSDGKIDKYAKKGYYSTEFREQRRASMAKKALKRKGNFVETDGRWVYCPV